MFVYIAKRIVFAIPVVFAVALVCFLLVHIAPGDPLVSVLPPDASQALAEQMRKEYGFDRPLAGAVRHLALERAARQSRHLDRERPLGDRGGRARGRQHVDAGGDGEPDRLRLRPAVRHSRRLLPRQLDRPPRDHDLHHRRVDAALLARHGAGDRVLRHPRMAAGGRHGSRAAGPGTGSISSI